MATLSKSETGKRTRVKIKQFVSNVNMQKKKPDERVGYCLCVRRRRGEMSEGQRGEFRLYHCGQ